MKHGTTSGYSQHYKKGEKPCRRCRNAAVTYNRKRAAERRAGIPAQRDSLTYRILEILETDGWWLTTQGIVAELELRFGECNELTVERILYRLAERGYEEGFGAVKTRSLEMATTRNGGYGVNEWKLCA